MIGKEYKAEKWTTVVGSGPKHDVWAVVDSAGNPVAFGTEQTMKEYADEANCANCVTRRTP